MRKFIAAACLLAALPASALPRAECELDPIQNRIPSSHGDAAMAPAMDGLQKLYRAKAPKAAAPSRWIHGSDAVGAGVLTYEIADMAPMTRAFLPTENSPYDHHFKGDMMKTPHMVRIGSVDGRPAWIAINKRPDSPLPPRLLAFLDLALSAEGQAVIAATPGFAPLGADERAAERKRLDAYVAPLDAALPTYRPVPGLSGTISSVGSDGMRSLMDKWQCRFSVLQPGVRKGDRWDHPGTLNGFHALLVGEADMAPMGRELWPSELAQWRAGSGSSAAPIEIAVARGGFNTPQRTTAQAIFVHPSNPIGHLSIEQLAAILGESPTITRWGQLGLTGEWADRPIKVLTPPHVAPNAMSMQMMLLKGKGWNAAAVPAPYAETARALQADPAAIGFGGLEEGAPDLKALAVADADGNIVPLDAPNAATGRYPFTRFMYIRLAPGKVSPQAAAFLRYILSREGQEWVRYSGYHPLTAAEAKAELAKLAGAAK